MKMIGDKTQWGKIIAILFLGERYYMMLDKDGGTSLMPATVVEAK